MLLLSLLSLVMLRYLLFYNAQSNFQASLLLLLSAGVDVIVVEGSSVLVAFARIWTCSFPLVSPGETQDCIKQKAEQNAERERDDQTLPFSELRDLLGYKHIRACKDTRRRTHVCVRSVEQGGCGAHQGEHFTHKSWTQRRQRSSEQDL